MPNETTKNDNATLEIPITLDKFLETMGISDSTAWRWRRDGMLKTENILGRVYIRPADLREFNRRMCAGEFAKEHKAPKKKKTGTSDDSSQSLSE